MAKTSDADNDDGPVVAGKSTALDDYQRGEFLNTLSVAAYTGRIGRRAFLDMLLKAGIAGAVAVPWADHAALAVTARNDARSDAQSRAVSDARSLRL